MSKEQKNKVGSLKLTDGKYTEDPLETLVHLSEVHFPGRIILNENEDVECPLVNVLDKPSWIKSLHTVERIKSVMFSFKPYKAPGMDGIYPIFIQKVFFIITDLLCNMFETSLLTGYIPKAWRKSRVIFIPKMGNRPNDEAKSLRPLTMSSILLKANEKNIDIFMREEYLTKNPVHHKQYAYQQGKSAIHAIISVKMKVEKALQSKNIVAGLAIDIEGAFDNTKHDVIKKALMKRKVDPIIIDWIVNMLTTRSLSVELNGSTYTDISVYSRMSTRR